MSVPVAGVEGEKLIIQLIKNKKNHIFDKAEEEYITRLIGKKYLSLSSEDKKKINTLVGWITEI